MTPEPQVGWLERVVAPRALLAGLVLSFLACCLAGRLVSRQNLYPDFVRFHAAISPEALYYPTANQVLALGLAGDDPDQVLVVVGGSSVMNGCGQSREGVWTRRLQDRLGPRYRVLNLGMRGGGTVEFGGVAAEMLAARHPKVIFVTSTSILGGGGGATFGTYQYLFWDARSRGLLPDDEEHQRWADQARLLRPDEPIHLERKWGLEVDRVVYGADLWTAVAYRYFATLWAWPVHDTVCRARCRYPDTELETPVPFAARYPPDREQFFVDLTRGELEAEVPLELPRTPLVANVEDMLPPSSRPRTLMLVFARSPYYVQRLTPDEQKRYRAVYLRAERLLEQASLPALAIGVGWSADDYYDFCHLSEAGGDKQAALVAPKVEEMARRLGYLD
jgi:hypothetical protein